MKFREMVSTVKTIQKAAKFLKDQGDIKQQANTFLDEVQKARNAFQSLLVNIDLVIDGLKTIINK